MFTNIKTLFLFVLVFFGESNAIAAKLDAPNVTKFMAQFESVINNGKRDTLKQFFKFYSSPESRYIITTYFIDPKKNEELISQDQTEMNRDQFVELLASANSTGNVVAYQYTQTVGNIDLTTYKDTGIVTYSYLENILTQKDATNQQYQKTVANCNMRVVVETADISISGLNCVRKIGQQLISTDTSGQSKNPQNKSNQPKS